MSTLFMIYVYVKITSPKDIFYERIDIKKNRTIRLNSEIFLDNCFYTEFVSYAVYNILSQYKSITIYLYIHFFLILKYL